MRWGRTVLSEVLGLFVDDVAFAVSILAWLVFAGVVLPRFGLQPWVDGVALFAGVTAILIESALRRARG